MPARQWPPFGHGTTPVPPGFISRLVSEFRLRRQHTVLEIGCGEGYLSRALAPYVARVDAIDESRPTLDRARALGDSLRVRYIESSAQDFVPDSSYNLVISLEAFHLMQDTDVLLQRVTEALVPGGALCTAWAEFFWEADLFPTYAPAFAEFGIDWGTLPNFAIMDLREIVASALPRIAAEYGSFTVGVHERFSLSEIAGYLASVSKASLLSARRKQQLRSVLVERFRAAGHPDRAEGLSRYIACFCRKPTDVPG
jgi:2-polyprenyl-3-methyl-5-hydroxy-6-metoxy-1,4-benzoquinol methylase